MAHEELKQYLLSWHQNPGQKPENEPAFVDNFIHLLKTLEDERDITFDGDGSYFGKQVTLALNSYYRRAPEEELLQFEIAYDQNTVRVYTARNEGYWVPPYLDMTIQHPKFIEVKTALFALLHKTFGL